MQRYFLAALLVVFFAVAICLVKAPSAQQMPYIKLAQVTNDEEVDLYPDVSSDGTKVAYMSYHKHPEHGKNFDIFIKEIKGGQTYRLDADEEDDSFPSWMADNQTVLFDSYRRVDVHAVWKKRIGGGTLEKVTNISEVALNADCAADNKRIVFIATEKIKKKIKLRRDGEFFYREWKKDMPNIYTIDADGSNLRPLNIQGINPKWSPGGKRIVFASNKYGNYEIFSLAIDGSDLIRLTSREAQDIEPAWSPDGRYIVFTSDEGDNWNLWVIKPDGTGLTQLTAHEEFEGGAMWAQDVNDPNEWYIYFHSDRNGNWDIWRLKPTEFRPIPIPAVVDADNDGVNDDVDQCPDAAEDVDGFEDEDGCPDPDNDNDGVVDQSDQCPQLLEDMDGFQDGDGCPDPDNDNDGVLDETDQCPNEAETFNTFQDGDGCPDEPPLAKKQTLNITFKVYSDELTMESIPLLETLVENLKKWPTAKIRLKVYTDSRQHRRKPNLTIERAATIKKYLIARGISDSRIEALGMGDAEPIASNRTLDGRRQNNRVVVELLGN
ncbi:MAG: OmpA family protein [Alphaproteobacteria bacterium]